MANLCFTCIFASFLDNIDGKIARLLKSNSNFGVELDSLSDLISFGVTPAIIVYYGLNLCQFKVCGLWLFFTLFVQHQDWLDLISLLKKISQIQKN